MSKTSNLKALVKDTKTRSILFVTVAVVGIVAVVAINSVKKPSVQMPAEMVGVQQISQQSHAERTAGEMDPRYREFFDRANEQAAQSALEQGSSSMIRIGDDPEVVAVRPSGQTAQPDPRPTRAQPAANTATRAAQPQQQRQIHPGVSELVGRWQPNTHVVHFAHEAPDREAPATVVGVISNTNQESGQDTSSSQSVIYYKAGDIAAATVVNTLNSDNPGPFVARIHSGPLAGSTLIGVAASGANGVGITGQFTQLSAPDGRIFPIQAMALSERDLSGQLASKIDRKLLNRFVFRPLVHFAKGMSDVIISQSGNPTVDTSGDSVIVINQPDEKMDRNEQIRVAVGMTASELTSEFDDPLKRRPTTHVYQNEVFGILFMSRVDSTMAQ